MNAVLATLCLALLSCAFVGCESDLPPDPSSDAPLRRGLSGQGRLVPIDHSDDPLIKETSGPAAN